MDEKAKKHALRLVPYGLYLAGFRRGDDSTGVSLVSWFTQTSFDPPLVVVGMHKESAAYEAVMETGALALNILGEGQQDILKGFFRHVECEDGKAGELDVNVGEATGCPLLPALPASLELRKVEALDGGDHAPVVFEVVDAHVHHADAKALSHEGAGLHYAG